MPNDMNDVKPLTPFERWLRRGAASLRLIAIPSFPVALWVTIYELPTTARTWGWVLSGLLLLYAFASAPDIILHAANGLPILMKKSANVLNRWQEVVSQSAERIKRVLGS